MVGASARGVCVASDCVRHEFGAMAQNLIAPSQARVVRDLGARGARVAWRQLVGGRRRRRWRRP